MNHELPSRGEWCPRQGLNPRPSVYKTAALPLSYKGTAFGYHICRYSKEDVTLQNAHRPAEGLELCERTEIGRYSPHIGMTDIVWEVLQ